MRPTAIALAVLVGLGGGAFVASRCSGEAAVSAPEPARFTIRGRWPGPPDLTFRVEDEAPIGAAAFARAVARAADVWTATGVVALRPAAPGEAADVTLGFRRGHHGACLPFGPGADVAHSGPVAAGTFVHFDLGREWSADGERGVSVFHTALHELGHVLGLGHSDAPEAVMGTDPNRPAALAAHDLAGLWSLYGGGEDGAGDLRVVRPDGTVPATLRRVAPRERCDYAAFDCDGDGRDEILVWRTDRDGHGAMTVYRFSRELRLEATLGPFPGAVAAGATVGFVAGPGAERLLVCSFASGQRIPRQFDEHGVPGMPRAALAPELLARAERRTAGDLDGDGTAEAVVRAGG